jgi:hypothetical protein
MNFDELGLSTIKDSTAFKKIQFFSKTNTESIFSLKSEFESNYQRISTLYNTDYKLMTSLNYGIYRQHNYNSILSSTKNVSTTLDKNSIDKFLSYNLNYNDSRNNGLNDYSTLSDYNHLLHTKNSTLTNNINNFFSNKPVKHVNLSLTSDTQYPTLNSFLGSETDAKQQTNTINFLPQNFLKKQKLLYKDWLPSQNSLYIDTPLFNPTTKFNSNLFNKESLSKFKNLKSNDLQLLSSERNPRLLGNFNTTNYTQNFSKNDNNFNSISSNLKNISLKSDHQLYNLSDLK